ncbi:MAG: putative lipid II flippase FtsW [Pseudomonadales bacterium]|jgi:cell division protein FtsW
MSLRIDYPLVMTWLMILALGTVMVTSTGIAVDQSLLPRQGVYLALAMLAFAVVLAVPLSVWQAGHRLCWLAAVVLCLLVLIPGIGLEANGARRWIPLGGFTLQPAEVAKFLLLVYLAGYLARFDERVADDTLALLKPMGMVGLAALLLLRQPDFGTAVVLMAASCALLFMAGARLRHYVLIVTVAGIGFLALIYLEPYRMARIWSFLDPWADANDGGYQLTQSLIAFGRGETFGLGLGEGIQKLAYLPEAETDFIYAVIAEELGLVGAIAVIVLFTFLVLRMLRVARMALGEGQKFGGYLVYGIALMLGMQAMVSLGVNTGVLPTKGLTLPFVSYGGNSLIVCCAMLALVCRVWWEAADG